MTREFELAEILSDDITDLSRHARLETAQSQPWNEPYLYRIISELEVPENPLMEPLVLNVWHQKDEASEWKLLT